MLGFAQKLMRVVRAEGVLGCLHRARYHCYERYREWTLGVTTAAKSDPYGPAGDQQRRPYEPLCYACIDTIFERVGVGPDDVLLDYGCGRGRITAVAATRPFRKVIGIELQPELCACARLNMRRVWGRQCQTWEIIEADASYFCLPDDVSLIILFNPFLDEILDRVVGRIEKSLWARPRAIQLVYMNPQSDRDVFESCPWLNLKAELPVGIWRGMRFRLYEHRHT